MIETLSECVEASSLSIFKKRLMSFLVSNSLDFVDSSYNCMYFRT